MTIYTLINWDSKIFDLYYVGNNYQIHTLYRFSYYLLIDGIFHLNSKFNLSNITSLIHHFVGSLGIYMIAESRMGFFLGFYFAMTEISTPFYNLSWIFRKG